MEDGIVCGYKLLRELGARSLPSYAALDPKPRRPEDALCVVERFARGTGASAEAAAEFLRDAKRLTQIKHPNLVRVRDVVLGTNVVLLVSDWIDGELLSEVQRIAAEQGVPIPLAGSLRVVVDLLEGLSALHEVCDAKRERLQIVHAEVAPRNIVLGIDGQSVLVHPLRAKASESGTRPDRPEHAPDAVGYLAPEVLLGDQTADQRADVYGAGVLLWEALAGHPMHGEGDDAGEIVMRLLGGKVVTPPPPADAPWAAPLVEVAKRAVSPDPSVRFANATAMLAEVRRVAGARLAPKLTVSALVEAVAGERIRARASGFGAKRTRARLPSESAWTTEAETAASTPRVPDAEMLDPEATRRPPPVRSPAGSRPAVTPSAKTPPAPAASARMPPAPAARATASPGAPPRAPPAAPSGATPFPRATPSSRSPAVPSSLGSRGVAAAVADPHTPPFEPDSLSLDIDIVETEAQSSQPAPPRPPPPSPPAERPSSPFARPLAPLAPPSPSSPEPLPSEMTETRTDMAAALISAPSVATKARWTIVVACALGIAGVLWMLLRPSGAAPPDSSDPPAPSVAGSAALPSPPPPAPTATVAVEPVTASPPLPPLPSPPGPQQTAEPGAVEPVADLRRQVPDPPPSSSPPIPTVGASPTTPPPAQAAPLAPAASSTHPKKRVYDPMGI